MQLENENKNGLIAEIKVVPRWAWALSAVGILCAEVFFNVVVAHQSNPPTAWHRALFGTMLGIVLGCYLLLIGYVSRDARRRGMSPVLWVPVAVLIPNGLGIILYFILRELRHSTCPQCGYRPGRSSPAATN